MQTSTDLDLTPGERLWLHRKLSGLSQGALADVFGVSVTRLRAWELDDGPVPVVPLDLAAVPRRLALGVVMRRHGVSLGEIAVALGRSAPWVHAALGGGSGHERVARYVAHRAAE